VKHCAARLGHACTRACTLCSPPPSWNPLSLLLSVLVVAGVQQSSPRPAMSSRNPTASPHKQRPTLRCATLQATAVHKVEQQGAAAGGWAEGWALGANPKRRARAPRRACGAPNRLKQQPFSSRWAARACTCTLLACLRRAAREGLTGWGSRNSGLLAQPLAQHAPAQAPGGSMCGGAHPPGWRGLKHRRLGTGTRLHASVRASEQWAGVRAAHVRACVHACKQACSVLSFCSSSLPCASAELPPSSGMVVEVAAAPLAARPRPRARQFYIQNWRRAGWRSHSSYMM